MLLRLLILAVVLLSACSHTSRAPSSANPAHGLYVNGAPGRNAAIELVQSAQRSIDIEIYEMEDVAFLEAVRAANARGVRVRIIKDPYPVPKRDQCIWFPKLRERDHWAPDPNGGDETNRFSEASCRENALPMIEEIRAKGGQVVPFYKPELCGQDEKPSPDGKFCYEHGKMIIVDGSAALLSTGNFNATNFCDAAEDPSKCNRDYSYITRNVAEIGVLTRVFENDLRQKRYRLRPIVEKVPSVTVSPYSLAPLVKFIREKGTGKGHTIQIQNQYLKERSLNEAVQAAARSGAKVQVMVASLCAFGPPRKDQKEELQKLDAGFRNAGVDFRYFPAGIQVQGRRGYLHAKSIVIDGKYAWMGSVNGSHPALNVNREFGIFFDDSESVKRLSDTMAADFNHPSAENFEESWGCLNDLVSNED